MSIKDTFGKVSEKILSSKQLQNLADEAESEGYLEELSIDNNRFLPVVDFSSASNFARYGSAEKYYVDAIKNTYQRYPYDGSKKEKLEWKNNSSQFDNYFFDNIYPKTTGFITLGSSSWAVAGVNAFPAVLSHANGTVIVSSSSPQYVVVNGGPNTSSTGKFEDANLFDTASNRGSNLAINELNLGNTVEFWYKQTTNAHVSSSAVFDLWNKAGFTSPNYTRFLIEVPATRDRFVLSYRSGSSGVDIANIVLSSFDVYNWHHYAFSVASSSNAKLDINFYVDGVLSASYNTGSAFSSVANNSSSVMFLGAYQTFPNVGYSGGTDVFAGAGTAYASFDEFRFWKEARTPRDIKRNWFTSVGGGSNTDDSNTELGVYLKFNEGVISTSSIESLDSKCLDYSGRISNGAITNYTANIRSTGSAITAFSSSFYEPPDPILYPSNSRIIDVLELYTSSGSVHDVNNNSGIYNSLPTWIVEQQEGIGTDDLSNLSQIISSYFDTLHIQIQGLSRLKDNKYYKEGDKPAPFTGKLLSSYDFQNLEIFNDTTFIEDVLSKNETEEFDESLTTIKNTIYQNIFNNLSLIYKSKGTEKGMRNLIRCFGVDDELIKINLYADNAQYDLDSKYGYTSSPKKYVDFNDPTRYEGTVYQKAISGNSNTSGALSGSYQTANKQSLNYIPITLQAEVIFPKKFDKDNENYSNPGFISSSLFGLHTANRLREADLAWGDIGTAATDRFNFQVYAEKRDTESADVMFRLTGSMSGSGFNITSGWYNDAYNNTKWNLAVRIKQDKLGNSNLVSGSVSGSLGPGGDYTIELVGINSTLDNVENSFSSSASIPASDATGSLALNKRIYAGAHYTNFTSSVLTKSDVKISSVRFWYDFLTNDELVGHSYDASSFGREYPTRNAHLGSSTARNSALTKADMLALNWDFNSVTGSDTNGNFVVEDASSGSIGTANRYGVGTLGYLTGFRHTGAGFGFDASDSQVTNKEYVFSAKLRPPETFTSNELIQIRDSDDVTFTRNTVPISYFYSIEKSMSDVINDEILSWFSTLAAFNNLVGEPADRYKKEYKGLTHLRQLFFEKVTNTPDFEKFLEFYKWIDSSISLMIKQLVPASANVSEGVRNIVESHLLERNKFENKLPTIENKLVIKPVAKNTRRFSINSHFAPHNPTGSLWLKQRAERSHPLVNTPGQLTNDVDREVIRKVINSTNLTDVPRQYDTVTGQFYEGQKDFVRGFAKNVFISSSILEHPEARVTPIKISNDLFSTASSIFVFASASVTGSGQIVQPVRRQGNHFNKYEVVQTSGRRNNNLAFPSIVDSYQLTSSISLVSGVVDRTLPVRKVIKTVFVERFSAPGGPEVNSRGAMDGESEEFSVYNGLNNRNSIVRETLNTWLAESSSLDSNNPSFHKTNKNVQYLINPANTASSIRRYDNGFVTRQIPRSDSQYRWISSSLFTKPLASGYFSKYDNLNVYNTSSIQFVSGVSNISESLLAPLDFVGLNPVSRVGSSQAFLVSVNTSSNTTTVSSSANSASILNSYLLNLNGPYAQPSWKQMRVGDSRLARIARKNNLIMVQDKPSTLVRTSSAGNYETFVRRSEPTFTSYVEPAVSYNKPMKHVVYAKGSKKPIEIVSSYKNNKEKFANEDLSKRLGVKSREETQIHDMLSDDSFYTPKLEIASVTSADIAFPNMKKNNSKESRRKANYEEIAGTGSTGYDRNSAFINTFWKEGIQNRKRTNNNTAASPTGSINPMGFPLLSSSLKDLNLTFEGKSAWTTPYSSPSTAVQPVTKIQNLSIYDSFWPLDNLTFMTGVYSVFGPPVIYASSSILGDLGPISSLERYSIVLTHSNGNYTVSSSLAKINSNLSGSAYYWQYDSADIRRVLQRPRITYTHLNLACNTLSTNLMRVENCGFLYITDQLTSKRPFFNSYEAFYEGISKKSGYSYIPEFRINDFMDYYSSNDLEFKLPITASYIRLPGTSEDISNQNNVLSNTNLIDTNILKTNDKKDKRINFKFDVIKKMLPYNGFYPQQRAVQVADLFQRSYFGMTAAELDGYSLSSDINEVLSQQEGNISQSNKTPINLQVQAALQPWFAPGILFNTIKSGIAVDWKGHVSDYSRSYDANSKQSSSLYKPDNVLNPIYSSSYEPGLALQVNNLNKVFNFESLLDIKSAFTSSDATKKLNWLDPTYYSDALAYVTTSTPIASGYILGMRNGESHFTRSLPAADINNNYSGRSLMKAKNSGYELSIHNYLSEIANFFLEDGKLNNFVSAPEKDFLSMTAGKVYSMDVTLEKDSAFNMFIPISSSFGLSRVVGSINLINRPVEAYKNFIPPSSNFGPPCCYTLHTFYQDFPSSAACRDPAFAPYTPSYYYGKEISRLTFTPSQTRVYNLSEILSGLVVENINTELEKTFAFAAGNFTQSAPTSMYRGEAAYTNRMKNSSSINLFQVSNIKNTSFDQFGIPVSVEDPQDSSNNVWSIQTKFETPILNFNTPLNNSASEQLATLVQGEPEVGDWVVAAVRHSGMWGAYGELPQKGKSIAFGLERSVTSDIINGSLIDVCGFKESKKEIGRMASKKNIGEAIILIPYTTINNHTNIDINYAVTIEEVLGENEVYESSKRGNGPYYYKLDKDSVTKVLGADIFKNNVSEDQIRKIVISSKADKNNSILKTITGMLDYNVPPHLNWLVNKEIEPFIMYIVPFEHNLDKQDLADIWQGLMPKISYNAEEETKEISHAMGENEFFHGKQPLDDLKFKIFKLKKKGKKNYYELTDDSKDDSRFKFDFENRSVVPSYSYNYPYDFFSLIELAKVEIGFTVEDPEVINKKR